MEKFYKRRPEVFGKYKGELLLLINLLDPESDVIELEGLSADVWNSLEEVTSRDELIEILKEGYTDPPEDLSQLIDEQLLELEKINLIIMGDDKLK